MRGCLPPCLRTARAEEDLIEIWLYIASDDPKAADKLLDRIEATFMLLAANPGIGPVRGPVLMPMCHQALVPCGYPALRDQAHLGSFPVGLVVTWSRSLLGLWSLALMAPLACGALAVGPLGHSRLWVPGPLVSWPHGQPSTAGLLTPH